MMGSYLVVVVVFGVHGVPTVVEWGRVEDLVIVDDLLQGADPVVVVLPLVALGWCGVLPDADGRDQALLEVAPVVVAELRKRQRQAECPSVPLVIELWRGTIGGAGLVQHHDAGPASATPIIDSVVTKSMSISSVKPSVPAGRSGMTNHRECPLLSHTLISVPSCSSTPISPSTFRGSRAARARNTGSLYQYGGRPSTGHGKHEHNVQMTRLCTPGALATACRCSPSAPAMPSGRSSSATAAGVLTTIFLPFNGVISDSK